MQVLNEWLLTPERVAIYLPNSTAVVADLHLGYDEARRRASEAVPLRPLSEVLRPLTAALVRHRISRLVIAGDLLEDACCQTAFHEFRAQMDAIGVEEITIVPGNHDRGSGPEACFGAETSSYQLGVWQVVHGDESLPHGPVVQGHEHPVARWSNRLGGPCYLVAEEHLVLPAFSIDAVGVNVLGARRWRNYRCCVIVGAQVLDFGPVGSLRRARSPGASG
jgi:putative SbcD/Mre11-related phosphoesterase